MRGMINEVALMQHKSKRWHRSITMADIATIVSQEAHIPLARILSKDREPPLPELRQMILYFGKQHNLGSLTKIGSYIGQPHDYVIYSIKQTNNRIDTDKDFRALVERIKNRL